jgi:hypothetical protein
MHIYVTLDSTAYFNLTHTFANVKLRQRTSFTAANFLIFLNFWVLRNPTDGQQGFFLLGGVQGMTQT